MHKKRLYFPLVFQILLVLVISYAECNEKPEPNIKNMTAIDNAKPKPKNDDPFKKDLRKYMRECGADVSGEDDDDDDDGGEKNSGEQSAEEVVVPKGQRPKDAAPNAHWAYEKKRGSGGKGGTYPSQYGKKKGGGRRGGSEEESEEDEDEDDYRGSSNRRKGGNNRRNNNNRKGNKKGRPSDDYDDSRGDNCEDDNRKGGGGGGGGFGSGGRKGFSSSQWGGMGGGGGGGMGYNRGGSSGSRYNTKNYGYTSGFVDPYAQKTEYGVVYSSSPEMWGSRTGYSTYGGRLMAMNTLRRAKRQRNEEQCMSQCVFGYLEMLDDNRVPAETEVIKYFQNKILNTTERMRLIKLSRKCFAKLSTAGVEIAENEDGCQFSKDLAKCLQIEIKGES